MKNECTDAITAALGHEPTDDELDRIASAVQQRMNAKAREGMADRRAQAKAVGDDMVREAKLSKALAERDAYNNIIKFQNLQAHAMNLERVQPGREDRALASTFSTTGAGTGRGIALSVEQVHSANVATLIGPANVELSRLGLLSVIKKGGAQINKDVARELWRLKDPTSGPASGNATAVAIAKVLGPVMDAGRAMQNNAGAWIGEAENYVGRQYHDMWKIRGKNTEADVVAWMDEQKQRLNMDATFKGMEPAAIDAKLRADWEAHANNKYSPPTSTAMVGGPNLGRKVSQERSYIYKSADDWTAYNDKYGKGSVMDAIYAGADKAARNAALMDRFGTDWQGMYAKYSDWLESRARSRGDLTMADSLRNDKKGNADLLDFVAGNKQGPASHTWASIGAVTRSLMSISHLGLVVTQGISHIPIAAAVLRHNGVPLWQAIANQVHALLPQGEGAREIALALNAGTDHILGHGVHRFYQEDGLAGTFAKGVNSYHAWTGLPILLDREEQGMGRALSHNLAFHAGKEFEQLPALMQQTMQRYGIEKAEWDAGRATMQTAADGRNYILPATMEDTKLGQKFQTLITDQIHEGINTPTAYARNLLTGGTRPGTPWGEIVRLMTQFKSFGTTFIQRQMGRTFARSGTDYPGAIYLAASMTVLGYIGNTLADLAHGNYQKAPDDAAGWGTIALHAMLKGGASGLMGDLLMRDNERSGGDVARSFLGPAGGTLADAVGALHAIEAGGRHERTDIAKTEGMKLLSKNLPNLWAIQAANAYLFHLSLMSIVNPRAVANSNRLLEKQGKAHIF